MHLHALFALMLVSFSLSASEASLRAELAATEGVGTSTWQRRLRTMVASNDPTTVAEAQVIAAWHDRLPERGWRSLSQSWGEPESWSNQPIYLRIAALRLLTRIERPVEALVHLDELAGTASGWDLSLAAEAFADAQAALGRWDEAVASLEQAIIFAKASVSQGMEADHIALLRSRQNHFAQLRDLIMHGAGFLLYRQARAAQMHGQPEEALQIFDDLLRRPAQSEPVDASLITIHSSPIANNHPAWPVYAAAARFHRGQCLLALGSERLGRRELAAVATESPVNPWAGEALRIIADRMLLIDADVKGAANAYGQALAFLECGLITSYQVPAISKIATAPPPSMRQILGWAESTWSQPEPQDLLNAETATWYADRQRILCYTRRSLCLHLQCFSEPAMADLEMVLKLDPTEAKRAENGMACGYLRLRDGYRRGRLHATAEELAQFTGRRRIAVALADVALETEDYSDAHARFSALLAEGRGTLDEMAYIHYATAVCCTLLGDNAGAEVALTPFDNRFAKTKSWPRAMLLLADLRPHERFQLLARVHHAQPQSEWGRKALLRIGQNLYAEHRLDEARRIFVSLAEAAPDTWFAEGSRTFITMIDKETP